MLGGPFPDAQAPSVASLSPLQHRPERREPIRDLPHPERQPPERCERRREGHRDPQPLVDGEELGRVDRAEEDAGLPRLQALPEDAVGQSFARALLTRNSVESMTRQIWYTMGARPWLNSPSLITMREIQLCRPDEGRLLS